MCHKGGRGGGEEERRGVGLSECVRASPSFSTPAQTTTRSNENPLILYYYYY